nr:hypothetical protein GCM10017547_38580 [Pseudarthrobacter oxydans]
MTREIRIGSVGVKCERATGTAVTPEPYILHDEQQRRVWFRRPLERFCRWLMARLNIEEAD